jgi:hypothetical protein
VAFYYAARNRKTNGWLLVLAILITIVIVDYVISAKRSGVIPLFLLPLIWYHYMIRRLSIGRAGILFVLAIFSIAGLLMARIALPLVSRNLAPTAYIGEESSEMLVFYINTGEVHI